MRLTAFILVFGVAVGCGRTPPTSSADNVAMMHEWEDAKHSLIIYPQHPQLLPAQERMLIKAILQHQHNLLARMGVSLDSIRNHWLKSEGKKMISTEELFEKRIAFWNSLKKGFPGLSLSSYSHREYAHLLCWTVPHRIASYGIFAKTIPVPRLDINANTIEFIEPVMEFYPVERVERYAFAQWGATGTSPLVFLGPILNLGVTQGDPTNQTGQTYYRTILIYRTALIKESREALKTDQGTFTRTQKVIQERLRQFLTLPRNAQKRAALEIAFLTNFLQMVDSPPSSQQILAKTEAHENRHVLDVTDQTHLEHFSTLFASAQEFIRAQTNLTVHEEINGMLGELRYSPYKSDSLGVLLISALDPSKSTDDDAHIKAAAWVFEQMVNAAVANPQKYGLALTQADDPQAQVILKLVGRDRLLEQLAADVYLLHRQHYTEDFSGPVLEQLQNTRITVN